MDILQKLEIQGDLNILIKTVQKIHTEERKNIIDGFISFDMEMNIFLEFKSIQNEHSETFKEILKAKQQIFKKNLILIFQIISPYFLQRK